LIKQPESEGICIQIANLEKEYNTIKKGLQSEIYKLKKYSTTPDKSYFTVDLLREEKFTRN